MPSKSDDSLKAKVAKIAGKYVYLNAGKQQGVQVGDVFEFGQAGVRVKDPESGEELGTIRELTLELRVEFVDDRFCGAVITYAQQAPPHLFKVGSTVVHSHAHRISTSGNFLGQHP